MYINVVSPFCLHANCKVFLFPMLFSVYNKVACRQKHEKEQENMVEFGEKLKSLREEKGMTQQTLAEQLYVTRQAVSRWECGARYPDLLTAKKIGQILEVSVDELISGEELRQNIEREPVLTKPAANIVQTLLYTIGVASYGLMCLFSAYSFFTKGSLENTPAAKITLLSISTMAGYGLLFAGVMVGLVFSIRGKLTAKRIGVIMSLPYVIQAISMVLQYIDMRIKNNGNFSLLDYEFLLCVCFAVGILLYFCVEEKRMSLLVIQGMCLFALIEILHSLKVSLQFVTELGLVVKTVHLLGKLCLLILLGYQAYVLDDKRKKGLKVKDHIRFH